MDGSRLPSRRRPGRVLMLALLIAASVVAQPGRDPTLLHRGVEPVVAAREQEQETALRRMLELGGAPARQGGGGGGGAAPRGSPAPGPGLPGPAGVGRGAGWGRGERSVGAAS